MVCLFVCLYIICIILTHYLILPSRLTCKINQTHAHTHIVELISKQVNIVRCDVSLSRNPKDAQSIVIF